VIEKVYELICDNPKCGNAMNHIMADSIKQTKEIAKSYGHIIKGDKCYCDQECFDTRKQLPEK
jgi:hypothetical protein